MENFQDRGVCTGTGLEKIMDPDPVCPESLDPNPHPVYIRLDPKPCIQLSTICLNFYFFPFVIYLNYI